MKGRTKLERKGRGFRERLLSLGIMAAVLVIAALVLLFKRNMDSVVLPEGAYNYFGDVKVEYTGKCRIQYTDKEVTIRDENGKSTLNSKPLYQPDGTALLPFDYAWYPNADNQFFRLAHFSTMAIENNSVVLQDGSLKAESANGYLYDGVDTYVFLENTELRWDGGSAEIPALSYAVARYGNTLQYFDYSTGTSTVVQTGESELAAAFANGDVLDMGTDTMKKANGTWYLLVARPGMLKRMENR